MFFMKSSVVRRVVLFAGILALLSGEAMAQNLSQTSSEASQASWHGTPEDHSGPGAFLGGGVQSDAFDKTDDEPEEVVAVVIDGAQNPQQGGVSSAVPTQTLSKVLGYFERLQTRLQSLMVRLNAP